MKAKSMANISVAGSLLLSFLLARSGWAVERQTLSGHIPAAVAALQPVGRLPAARRLDLAIGLTRRNLKLQPDLRLLTAAIGARPKQQNKNKQHR
jgi:hypothetical protein